MDLIKIGKFIAELRKEQKLTQEELGNKLGVTNKTISRWETGTYLPPGDVLLSMGQLFSVSINEILSGKRLAIEEYKEAAEENLKQTIKTSSFNLKDRIDFYKKKWLKDHIALMVFLGVIVVVVFVTGLLLRKSLIVYASMVLLICFHGYRYNAMMTSVEKKAYDCLGNKR